MRRAGALVAALCAAPAGCGWGPPPPLTAERAAPRPGDERAASVDEDRGSASREVIRAVIRPAMPRVRACYQDELAITPTLAGRVVVRFYVGPDGHATRGEYRSELEPEGASATGVAACIRDVVATLRFPAPADGQPVAVEYPFALEAAGP